MASGKPDWNRVMTVQGKYLGEWRALKVDDDGQLYIALVGQQIEVTQDDPDRTMQGKSGANLRYVAVDDNGVMLSRIQGEFTPDVLKDVAVDTNGNLICLIKGISGVTETTLHVDGDGKIIAKIQGATGGDLIVYVLDDCGDTDLVSNWSEAEDGLSPSETTTFVREGSVAMKLGIDADLFGTDVATWMNSETIGDLTGLNEDKVKIWVYINTLDYLLAAGTCFHFRIGSGGADYVGFNFTKADLEVGWNEIVCDLSSPDMTLGAIDWSAINTQLFEVTAVAANTDDFYIVVDSITVVRDNPDPGTMKDLNTDANGFLLSRMVGSFGDYNKPLSCDRYGNLRSNPTQTDKKPLLTNDYHQTPTMLSVFRTHPGIETYELINLGGPGQILSMLLYHYASAAHITCYLTLIVDGVTLQDKTYTTLNAYKMITDNAAMMPLINYDTTNDRYMNTVRKGLYFKESFIITIDEVLGGSSYTRLEANYVLF